MCELRTSCNITYRIYVLHRSPSETFSIYPAVSNLDTDTLCNIRHGSPADCDHHGFGRNGSGVAVCLINDYGRAVFAF